MKYDIKSKVLFTGPKKDLLWFGIRSEPYRVLKDNFSRKVYRKFDAAWARPMFRVRDQIYDDLGVVIKERS